MAVLICTALFSIHIPLHHSTAMEQMGICLSLVAESQSAGVAPSITTALAWHETRLRANLTSSKGAKGPLQVIPRFWCKSDPCDYVRAGLRALKHYRNKEPTVTRAICRYNAGTCIPKAWEFAESVVRLRDKVSAIVLAQESRSQRPLKQSQPLPRGSCCPTMDAQCGLLLW